MTNIITNEIFARALQWLYSHGRVKDQKDFAAVTGITETTISRILNDKVRHPSSDTIRKVSSLFPGVFDAVSNNRQSKITERAQDIQMAVLGHIAEEPKVKAGIAADEDPRPYLPPWAETLLGILSKQIAENEILHQELKDTTEKLNEIIKKLQK
jgi:transcriptional regulator with XRE-family HTH domain